MADPAVIAGGPEALLPLPTPIAYGAERPRLAALFQLPLPYLPEDMLRRGLHETVGDWRVRMTIALDMLGAIGFDDDFIYQEMPLKPEQRHKTMQRLMGMEALKAFRMWEESADKTEY